MASFIYPFGCAPLKTKHKTIYLFFPFQTLPGPQPRFGDELAWNLSGSSTKRDCKFSKGFISHLRRKRKVRQVVIVELLEHHERQDADHPDGKRGHVVVVDVRHRLVPANELSHTRRRQHTIGNIPLRPSDRSTTPTTLPLSI